MAMMFAAIISLANQFKPGQVQFHIMDGSAGDSPFVNMLPKLKDIRPHQIELVDYRNVGDTINQIATEVSRRQAGEENGPTIFLVVYGLQRYRSLRKSESRSIWR